MTLVPLIRPKKIRFRRFGVYDLEWFPNTYQVRLVGFRTKFGYQSFLDVAEFLTHVLRLPYVGMTFFAHAGGLADVQFILQTLVEKGSRSFEVKAAFAGSAAIIVRVRSKIYPDRIWTFADSYWLLRSPLAKIAKSIDLKKLNDYTCPGFGIASQMLPGSILPCGHLNGHCVFYSPMPILRDYNKQDCEILYRALHRLQRELGELGVKMKATAASTALAHWRTNYLTGPIETSEPHNNFVRPAYVSSRVENARRELGPGKMFDINSSFSHSMVAAIPGRLVREDRIWKEDSDETDLTIARATVTIRSCRFPPIPYRTSNQRIYFPTGTMSGMWTGVDLNFLLQQGHKIKKIERVWHYEPRFDMADYALDIYEKKATEKDPFRKELWKLFLNALYGKMAESTQKDSLLLNPSSYPKCDTCLEPCDCVREAWPGAYIVKTHHEVPHAHVPIAAYITARSRKRVSIELERTNAAYCDTDSIATDIDNALPVSDNLGDWKVESCFSEALFLAPKLYALRLAEDDWKIRAKGFSRITIKEFLALASGQGVERNRMIRLKESIRTEGKIRPQDLKVIKVAHFQSRPKRRFDSKGNSVPWTVKDVDTPYKKE